MNPPWLLSIPLPVFVRNHDGSSRCLGLDDKKISKHKVLVCISPVGDMVPLKFGQASWCDESGTPHTGHAGHAALIDKPKLLEWCTCSIHILAM